MSGTSDAPLATSDVRSLAEHVRDTAGRDAALARRLATHYAAASALGAAGAGDPAERRGWLGLAWVPAHGATGARLRLDPGALLADAVVVIAAGRTWTMSPARLVPTPETDPPPADRLAGGWLPAETAAVVPGSAAAVDPGPPLALRELLLLSIELGVLQDFSDRALLFLRTRARAWYGTGISRAGDDPHTLRAVGRWSAQREALQELWSDAVGAVQAAFASPFNGARQDPRPALALARHHAAAIGPAFVSGLIEVLGAPSTDRGLGFDAPWRVLATLRALDPPPLDLPSLLHHVVSTVVSPVPPTSKEPGL